MRNRVSDRVLKALQTHNTFGHNQQGWLLTLAGSPCFCRKLDLLSRDSGESHSSWSCKSARAAVEPT